LFLRQVHGDVFSRLQLNGKPFLLIDSADERLGFIN
jgi:hypothetical protein